MIAGALLAWSPAMFLAGMTGWLAGWLSRRCWSLRPCRCFSPIPPHPFCRSSSRSPSTAAWCCWPPRLSVHRTTGSQATGCARWGAPGTPLLGVLLQGARQITQGFDGALSHRGIWSQSPGADASQQRATGSPLVIETGLLDNGHSMIRQGQTDGIAAAPAFDAFRLTAHHAAAGSLVSLMALCLTTIPYAAFPGLIWNDWLPHAYPSLVHRYLGQINPLRGARPCETGGPFRDGPAHLPASILRTP